MEQPVRGLTSLITHQDVPVLVAVNGQGVYVIDDIQCVSNPNVNALGMGIKIVYKYAGSQGLQSLTHSHSPSGFLF